MMGCQQGATKSFTDFFADRAAISAAHLKIIHEIYRLVVIGRSEGDTPGREIRYAMSPDKPLEHAIVRLHS
jgi:hypothetical protein